MAAGNVNTQAIAILRTVESCTPEPFGAMSAKLMRGLGVTGLLPVCPGGTSN
jgi:hypothetical protein